MAFKWTNGQDIPSTAEFGDPTAGTDYAFCLYDESRPSPTLLFSGLAPHAGSCAGRPCWETLGSPTALRGFRYADKDLTPNGTASLSLNAGLGGKASATYAGKKENLDLAPFTALPLALRAQIRGTNGASYGATFHAATMNARGRFKAKAD